MSVDAGVLSVGVGQPAVGGSFLRWTTSWPRRMAVYTALLALMLCAASSAAAEPFTGRWEHRGQNESGLWLLTHQSKNLVRFQLELSRGAPSYNSGWIQGAVELQNNVGHFRESTDRGLCEITFHFQKKRVELTQTGEYVGCGFGYGVLATGVLQRTSYKPPKFCAGDPRAGDCE